MSTEHTTEQDLQWLLADDTHEPPPIATATLGTAPEETRAADVPPANPTEYQDGAFTEAVDGEVVDNPPTPRGVPVKWLIPIGVGALLIALTVMVVVLPIIQASATVIITPDRQSLEVSTTFSIQARKLFTRSLTLAQTVKTTGTAHQNASVASGYVTFYNALPSPQTIPAGTLMTGADGVNVITEQDAYIPAGALSVNGQVTVVARTATTGATANIQAGDINGACCREYVFARNGPFAGGRAARDYRTATKTDIQTVTQDLNRITTAAFANQARGQLQSTEASLPPQCTGKTESSQSPGAEAAQITVTLASTCSVYAYSQAELNAKETAVFSQAITAQLGSGYALSGPVAQQITGSTLSQGVLMVAASLTGTCTYRFRGDELRRMQQLVAGKSREQATALLLHMRGVRTVGIQIDNGNTTLPGDTQHVAISVYDKA